MTDQDETENDKTIRAARALSETSIILAAKAMERDDKQECSRLLANADWYKEYAERLENGE